MMSRWLVSVPVWGRRYVDVFCATALPALERAMLCLPTDARLVVHTDEPDRLRAAATKIPMELRPVPAGLRDFDCLSQAHREVLAMACHDDRVALLTADLVLSTGSLLFCENKLADGKRLIACAGIRAIEEGRIPNVTSGRKLLKWAWDHRHPIVQAATWPNGRLNDLSRIYFSHNGNVVARWCLPHPLALRVDGRQLSFAPTIDVNLINNFHESEIHLVIDPDEVAMVELSPRNKFVGELGHRMKAKFENDQMLIPPGIQRWSFNHKIIICGHQIDCGDDPIVTKLLSV